MKSSPSDRHAAHRYLFLSMLSGVLEIGAVLSAAVSGRSVVEVVTIGMLYQVGAVLVAPIRLRPRSYRAILVAAGLAGAGTLVVPASFPLAVLLTGIGLQGLREHVLPAGEVRTAVKRTARIAGFVVATMFTTWFLIALPLVALAVAKTPNSRSVSSAPVRPRFHRHAVLMVVHQTHYFMYAYTLLFVLAHRYAPDRAAMTAAFALGWVTYTAAPSVLGRLPTRRVLVAGHVGVALLLIVIGLAHNTTIVTGAWIASGFGGGTVFCIKRLARSASAPRADLDSWENIGHIVGCATTVVLLDLFPLSTVFYAAAGVAAATAATALVFDRTIPTGLREALDRVKALTVGRRGPRVLCTRKAAGGPTGAASREWG